MKPMPTELPPTMEYMPMALLLLFLWAFFSQRQGVKTFRRRMAKSSDMRRFYLNCIRILLLVVNLCFASSNDYYVMLFPVLYSILLFFDTSAHILMQSINEGRLVPIFVLGSIAVSSLLPICWASASVLFVIFVASLLYPSRHMTELVASYHWPKELDKQDELVAKYYSISASRTPRQDSANIGKQQ